MRQIASDMPNSELIAVFVNIALGLATLVLGLVGYWEAMFVSWALFIVSAAWICFSLKGSAIKRSHRDP
jgi:hypothetical protein